LQQFAKTVKLKSLSANINGQVGESKTNFVDDLQKIIESLFEVNKQSDPSLLLNAKVTINPTITIPPKQYVSSNLELTYGCGNPMINIYGIVSADEIISALKDLIF
jgi:hypothetical protein